MRTYTWHLLLFVTKYDNNTRLGASGRESMKNNTLSSRSTLCFADITFRVQNTFNCVMLTRFSSFLEGTFHCGLLTTAQFTKPKSENDVRTRLNL